MQVILQPLLSSTEGSPIVVDTNPQATIETLISAFCTQKGVAYSNKLAIFDGKKRPLPQYSTIGSLGITNGQNLLIGYKDTSFTLRERWPLIIAFGALIIGLIGIITLSMVYGLSGGVYPYDFGVVMDAGSSKTNTIVYKWQGMKYKGTGCVIQEDKCRADGGIAKMDPMKLDTVINCAKNVTERVDPESRPKTPLFFAATAGMRLLNITDPDKVNQILNQLDMELNETGLTVKEIEIIPGRDEGIYGWITANFLLDNLETETKRNPWIPTTYGALDMGGASMQIAYALPPEDKRHSKNEIRDMTLYGQEHHVFAMSNLCFGRDEAQRRYRSLLVSEPTETKIMDPCLAFGFQVSINGSELFDQPCTHNKKITKWLENDESILEREYTFEGSSDYPNCQKNVAKLLDSQFCKDMQYAECFRKMNNLLDNQKYLAFATYFYTTNFLNLTKSNLEEYETGTKNFCMKNKEEILKIKNNTYVKDYCFNAQYVHEVLINGFGFTGTNWTNLEFVEQIAGKDVGWTLGYMINATNMIPQTKPSSRLISAAALTVSLVLFVLVVIATAVFLIHTTCRKGNSNTTVHSLYGSP